ncbi:MAG: HDOD domain-containing protein [Candidatus Polarisedimenticolaceae bacterium]|nr:HDOD domain-containing protein [Candidatus Polarisedimenticolaceae bacterium]
MSAEILVKDLNNLVALPQAYLQISQMINSPRHSALDIGKIIAQDTDLSARLLRIVNSAFYGIPVPIETISRAVTIVGTSDLHDLVLATSACRMFKDIPGELMDMGEFWGMSVYTGIVASTLAERCNILHCERLFVQGMLHDIGRLPIYLRLPEQARDILLATNGDYDILSATEQEILGFTHTEVGALLTRDWKLPESIQTVTHYHHQPELAAEYKIETSLIHISSILAECETLDESTDEILARVNPYAWQITGLTQQDVESVLDGIPQQAAEVLKLILPATG